MINIPQISNLRFYTESSLAIDSISEKKEQNIHNKINSSSYELFCRNKFRKPLFDLYAMFNPFNEANKAFYPFISYLKKKFKKGDVILDIWSRTGWSTAMLSGLFPEQKIISIWEGDTDVLGYNGFAYWFSDQEIPSNVEIYFCNLKEKLPFEDQSIAFVFGFDLLHRQLKTNLIPEILRVSQDNALILFPHVHLSNNEPVPYFSRCGDLIHGRDYEAFFEQLKPMNKSAYVFSEPDLYRKSFDQNFQAKANPDTADYNGLIAIAPTKIDLESELQSYNFFDYFDIKAANILLNPLLEVDSNNQIIYRKSDLEDEILNLLQNHPVYEAQLEKTLGYHLSNEELILLYWARKCRTCSFIQKQLGLDETNFKKIITKLERLDILQIVPITSKQVRLQHYFSHQEFIDVPELMNLQTLWQRSVRNFPENTFAFDRTDETFYNYREFNEIVNCITYTLQQKGFKKGDTIILEADIHFEAMGLFWACMNLGVVFVPINSDLPEALFNDLIVQYQPKIVFLNYSTKTIENPKAETVYFDSEDFNETGTKLFFSDWLLENEEMTLLLSLHENDLAVILHTSGSSGKPKGVLLTHGQLFQSAINMVTTYKITNQDKYLSIGNLDSMSGLRNACLVTATAGASCVLPSKDERNNISALLDGIYEADISFLVASPSLLNQFLSKKEVKNRLAKVSTVLSTGSNLSKQLKELFFEKTTKKILNYYGLTETTGFCLGETHVSYQDIGHNIGKTIDCIAQIVDENNQEVPIGVAGELRIYSYCNTQGYHSNNSDFDGVQDWFYTGDLAKKTVLGTIELTGRKKDFIKNARSEIVYFQEIEDVVQALGDVVDTGLISFFDNESEKLALFVEIANQNTTPEIGIGTIKEKISKQLGQSKVPSVIKIIEKMPRTSHGKIIKTELQKYL